MVEAGFQLLYQADPFLSPDQVAVCPDCPLEIFHTQHLILHIPPLLPAFLQQPDHPDTLPLIDLVKLYVMHNVTNLHVQIRQRLVEFILVITYARHKIAKMRHIFCPVHAAHIIRQRHPRICLIYRKFLPCPWRFRSFGRYVAAGVSRAWDREQALLHVRFHFLRRKQHILRHMPRGKLRALWHILRHMPWGKLPSPRHTLCYISWGKLPSLRHIFCHMPWGRLRLFWHIPWGSPFPSILQFNGDDRIKMRLPAAPNPLVGFHIAKHACLFPSIRHHQLVLPIDTVIISIPIYNIMHLIDTAYIIHRLTPP